MILSMAKAELCQPPKPMANTKLLFKLWTIRGVGHGSSVLSPCPKAPELFLPQVNSLP